MPFNRVDGDLIEIRPRFQLKTVLEKEQVLQNLMSGLEKEDSVVGRTVLDSFYLDIPRHEQKYWSPELRASVESHEDGKGSLIRVVIGPRHTVWLFFVFLYAFLGVMCLFGGMYGIVQLSLGINSLWIYCFPIILLLIGGIYLIAKLGQRATRDQMLHLTSYLYHHILDDKLERIG